MPVNDDPCPLCGGRVTYRGLAEIECVTDGCDNCPLAQYPVYHTDDFAVFLPRDLDAFWFLRDD